MTLADGTSYRGPDFGPFDLPAAHIFEIGTDHRFHEVQAIGFVALAAPLPAGDQVTGSERAQGRQVAPPDGAGSGQ